ncbi:hypothetical protein [Fibrella forsythiae]|uniref:Lipoprotein n=1 Tax=Fibrella forsythiae TaxID=2817061 RepID=A0ABS3JNX1_9BACT|nr:hypothetical protein [Fibrella forsythiae]MBO0951699.1 hypothetical protein [Fibrella forsythiae]
MKITNLGHLINWLYIITCSNLLMAGCQHEPKPFQVKVGKYNIQFPVTSAELQREYHNAVESVLVRLEDTTKSAQATWYFKKSLRDPRRQPYGVIIKLHDKGEKLDSIRTAFEHIYQKPMLRFRPTHLSEYEGYDNSRPIWVTHVNRDTQVALCVNYINDIDIFICYNLEADEEERFVSYQGNIRQDD